MKGPVEGRIDGPCGGTCWRVLLEDSRALLKALLEGSVRGPSWRFLWKVLLEHPEFASCGSKAACGEAACVMIRLEVEGHYWGAPWRLHGGPYWRILLGPMQGPVGGALEGPVGEPIDALWRVLWRTLCRALLEGPLEGPIGVSSWNPA